MQHQQLQLFCAVPPQWIAGVIPTITPTDVTVAQDGDGLYAVAGHFNGVGLRTESRQTSRHYEVRPVHGGFRLGHQRQPEAHRCDRSGRSPSSSKTTSASTSRRWRQPASRMISPATRMWPRSTMTSTSPTRATSRSWTTRTISIPLWTARTTPCGSIWIGT